MNKEINYTEILTSYHGCLELFLEAVRIQGLRETMTDVEEMTYVAISRKQNDAGRLKAWKQLKNLLLEVDWAKHEEIANKRQEA